MRRVRPLEEIIAGQLADAEAADRRAEREERWNRPGTITAWAHRWTKALKAVATLVGAGMLVLTGVSVGAGKLYRFGRRVYAVVTLYRASNIGAPELPSTGQPTIATDRVPEPKRVP
jgi:uncharacterized protein with ACT and thioredoxin-like domain